MNGKEGTIGEMPQLGVVLTDDQIAAVLTYVRREWGQPGSPVDAAMVRTTRTEVAGRTRPWTNAELLPLTGGAAAPGAAGGAAAGSSGALGSAVTMLVDHPAARLAVEQVLFEAQPLGRRELVVEVI